MRAKLQYIRGVIFAISNLLAILCFRRVNFKEFSLIINYTNPSAIPETFRNTHFASHFFPPIGSVTSKVPAIRPRYSFPSGIYI